ncbi:MAG: ATP-binding protein [Candidatus Omnitrophica bacterium]|nr:ATP-binding protein [Candidatus Omnitrophota bacterium]
MTNELFESVRTFPDSEAFERYNNLVGLDFVKERLEKEVEIMLRPDLLNKWSAEKHGAKLPALDMLQRRPPLFLFAGDVGTGKTELSMTFGDKFARANGIKVDLFCLSLRARGSGAVGEMTRLITDAFRHLRSTCQKIPVNNKKPTSATILLIDEADSLAQSREMAQMHHEDRAGVNALIRGIDDIATAKLSCLIVMCTNRLNALDPAVRRRAAAVFPFNRPTQELRTHLLETHLAGAGLSKPDIEAISVQLGVSKTRDYGYTFCFFTVHSG